MLLSAADVFVLPTASEGLANAWVEALACGTPVVTTPIPGARELITDPAYGRLVERDGLAISDAVRELLDAANPQEKGRFRRGRVQLGRQCRSIGGALAANVARLEFFRFTSVRHQPAPPPGHPYYTMAWVAGRGSGLVPS